MNKNTIEAIYPLSPMQKGMLFHTLYDTQAGLYFEQLICHCNHGLDIPAFKQAWQDLVQRHPVLRTQFMWENLKDPLQVVQQHVTLPWVELDWQHLDGEQRQEMMVSFLADDRSRGLELSHAPVLRITLIQMSAESFQCIVSFHHLILDGWSMPLLLGELRLLYIANHQGKQITLESRRPYRDYINWLQRQDKKQAAAFWREYLRHFHTPTSLMQEAGTVTSLMKDVVSNSEVSRELSGETILALRALTRQHKLTMNTILQAAWALLLSRYSGTDDVVFGGVVSGRPPELQCVEQMIGLFINTLPVRIHIPATKPIYAWLQDVQLQQIEARQYEYSSLVEIQGWSELPRGVALFESILVFENYPVETHSLPEESCLHIEFEQALEQTNYPLSLEVSFNEEQLSLRLVYDSSRFDGVQVSSMLQQLCALLAHIAAHPEACVPTLSLLSAEERLHILEEWNATQQVYPYRRGVHELFEAQVERSPQAPAIEYNGTTLTYTQLNERANQLAHYLRICHIGPDVLVGLAIERSPEMVIGLLAVLKAGGAYVPLDLAYPKERLSFMISDARMSVLLTMEKWVDSVSTMHNGQIIVLDTDWPLITQQRITNLEVEMDSTNLAYVIYTSGSTGTPKGVLISHQGLVNYLYWACQYYTVQQGQGSVVHSSLSFDLTVTSLFSPLLVGAKIVLVPEDEDHGIESLSTILRQGYEFSLVKITPAHLELLKRLLTPEEMSHVTHSFVIGGEALQSESLAEWRRYAPATRIINEYGPTETVVGCCIYELSTTSPIQGLVPIGCPIANTQLYILDASLQLVPVGIPGELYISGDGLARGYLNRPDLTAERFIAHPFSTEPGQRLYKTGDQARYRRDGTIEFLGRLDHQVKVRGFRIELGEIESALRLHPDIQASVVVVRANAAGNAQLIAYVTARMGHTVLISDLRGYLQEKLPEYMLPSTFVLMDDFLLTSNGKVDRNALPEPGAARLRSEEMHVGPLSPRETQLITIWSQVLGLEHIGIHDNFFALGGDSIQGLQIIDQARKYELHLALKQLFRFPTIAELAIHAGASSSLVADQGIVTGLVPFTPIQHWFFTQDLPERNHWNQAMVVETRQVVHPDYLKHAFEALCMQHDALRMRFVHQDDGWKQENAPFDGWVPFSHVDLSMYEEMEQEQCMQRIEAELQGSLHITEGPLFCVALFDRGKHRSCRILMIIHHLVVDSVSWRILLDDIQTAYQQIVRGQPVRLPSKTTSFKYYAEQLVAYAQSITLRHEMSYWGNPLRELARRLPVDYSEKYLANSELSAKTISCFLSVEETQALLQEVPRVYHTQINDILLTALVQAVVQWTGQRYLLVDMEGHGREDLLENVNLSHTIGWFTSLFPILLDAGNMRGPGEDLQAIKEQLRAVPERGVGYGLLRYLCNDSDVRQLLQRQPQADISFNYLGQLDQTQTSGSLFGIMHESEGCNHSLLGQRSHVLAVGGMVVDARLQMQWTFSENLHRSETIMYLAESYLDHLRFIIQHCLSPSAGGYTPSDFPLARLNEEKLQALSLLLDDMDEEEATI